MNELPRRPGTQEDDIVFSPVGREVRLSDKVAGQLLETISSGRYQPGDQLPSERDLARMFAVSRTVIREAVRSLVARGLVTSQSGSRLRVTAMSAENVSESMTLLVNSVGSLNYGHVHEVRTVLELATVRLAAERRTPKDLSVLFEAVNGLDRIDLAPADAAIYDVAFHRGLAEATKNELFVVLLDSIADVLFDVRLRGLTRPSGITYAHRAHATILERVAAQDVDGARSAMRLHLEESQVLVGQAEPGHGVELPLLHGR